MTGFVSILLSVFAALVALGVYRYVPGVRSRAKKRGTALVTGPNSGHDVALQAQKASDFPDDWWTGDSLFDLERRAIFSKQWTFISHQSNFTRPGDYHTYELANFPIFLILGKDHVIRAFHNVCRHRAYTITKKKSGSSTVLGCRYHGWSYDTRGRLVKAPAFDNIASFDRSQNGLFEIHTHTTRQGFIFVNLNTTNVSALDAKVVDVVARAWGISERSAPLAVIDVEESLNWKQAVFHMEQAGYLSKVMPTAWHELASKMPFFSGVGNGDVHCILDSHGLNSLHVAAGGRLWYTFSASPISVGQTRFTCHIYLNWPGDNAQSDIAMQIIKDEVQSLLLDARRAPPVLDAAAAELQKGILNDLTTHLKEERKNGKEVWPASRESTVSEKYNQADLLCKQLSCLKPKAVPSIDNWGKLGSRSELDW
ncbi:iron-sulfur cluster-binding protein [Macrophomina phaseolina]|uniref:Iron-sulfur cluster-binding protein n=1 Tax=Macrophomina phaseolina TaxID=35725 RepID=A0ABQ8GHT7_9PEZI|nr:iron-sulfur cluster-binding protein [Macrophomina phaseolina]